MVRQLKWPPARALATLVAALLVLALAYWGIQGALVFRSELGGTAPTPDNRDENSRQQAQAAAAATRVVTWQLADGSKQRAFYLAPRNGAVIVYAHGAPGAASGLLPEALGLASHGYGALLVDLPGYGESEGPRDWGPSFQLALRRAVDFAETQPGVNPRRIGGFGYSMGGHAIAQAAAEDPRIAALVLLATPTTLLEAYRARYRSRFPPGLMYFAVAADWVSGVPVSKIDPSAALRAIGVRPVLVIAGALDNAVPGAMTFALTSTAANGQMWLIDGIGHTGFAGKIGEPYFERMARFWDAALANIATPEKRGQGQ